MKVKQVTKYRRPAIIDKQEKAKRVLVTGDRHWKDFKVIARELGMCRKAQTIIHGNALGADSIAGEIADCLGMEVEPYPANWDQYGKSAGPRRNSEMLKKGKPDFVLAFHSNLAESKGTADMVRKALAKGLPVKVVAS